MIDKLGVEDSEVSRDADFIEDLGADSLDIVEMVMDTEKEFGISIPDDEAEKIYTFGEAVDYINPPTSTFGR